MSNTSKDNIYIYKSIWFFPIMVIIFVVFSWLITWYFLHADPDRGTFGDMFGGLNALLSGLAFTGVIIAILLQRKELQYQRKGLEQTRNELKDQNKQLKAQNMTFSHQRFDNTFFQMLHFHNEIVASIRIVHYKDNNDISLTARECFETFYQEIINSFEAVPAIREQSMEKCILSQYDSFYQAKQPKIGHYFKHLYNIIKLINSSDINNKEFYADLLISQLSTHELLLLFYHALSSIAEKDFKSLIEKYCFFKDLPMKLLWREQAENPYEKSAFNKDIQD